VFDKKDRLGLKIHWCFTDDDALENLGKEESFIKDAVATAIRLFGSEKAKRMVLEEFALQTAAPSQGKQPNQRVNEYLLAEFDRQANDLGKTDAVMAAAEAAKGHLEGVGSVESIVSRIWGLLRKRKESQRAWAEYEIALAEDRKKRGPMLIFDEIESEPNPADL
jgi:hypothetical protein